MSTLLVPEGDVEVLIRSKPSMLYKIVLRHIHANVYTAIATTTTKIPIAPLPERQILFLDLFMY